MKKTKQIALRFGSGIVLLLLLFWFVVNILVGYHQKSIHGLAIAQINKQVKGTVQIGTISSDFLRTFPHISVRLSEVSIKDSLWDLHHHDFLKASKIYASFQFLSLLKGKPKIRKVIVENGFIHLYTDACGYCNLNRSEAVSFNKGRSAIPEFTFKHTRLIVENEALNSYHDITAEHLECQPIQKDSMVLLNLDMKSIMHSVAFNLERGSYLKDKVIEGKFCLEYYTGKEMKLNNVQLKIDHQPFTLTGSFHLGADTMSYDLLFQTQKIPFTKAVSILTEALQKHFVPFEIQQPFDVEAHVAGKMAFKVIPKVTTQFSVNNSDLETPLGMFTLCSFFGTFTNQMDTLSLPGDENSKFVINNFHGLWSNLPISSTRMEISNLKEPFVICDLQSVFALEALNELAESSTIRFVKGTGNLDVTYYGSLVQKDSIQSALNGTLSLRDAELQYLPRNLVFKNCSGVLEFKNEDLIIQRFEATAGNTLLTMNGRVANLLAMLSLNPEQLTMEWNISTPALDLSDFISYASQRGEVIRNIPSRQNKIIQTAENIDRMLSDGTAKLNLSAEKLTYKKFVATKAMASVWLLENKVYLKDVNLNHSGGKLFLKGLLTNGKNANMVELESRIEHVNIPDLFYAFDNFGQDAITNKNMKGHLSATITIAGVLTDKATILENSMKGYVDFTVQDGELIEFEPVINIGATAFKKRDFSHLQFAELRTRIEIDGSAITFHKMEIRSNVVILFVEGVYDTKKGTDMSIQVPVSTLTKSENETLQNTGRAGMNVRLRAKTGEDGKVKINWDPFNNATRKRKE